MPRGQVGLGKEGPRYRPCLSRKVGRRVTGLSCVADRPGLSEIVPIAESVTGESLRAARPSRRACARRPLGSSRTPVAGDT